MNIVKPSSKNFEEEVMKVRDLKQKTKQGYVKNDYTIDWIWSIFKNKNISQKTKDNLKKGLSKECLDLIFNNEISDDYINKMKKNLEYHPIVLDNRTVEEFCYLLLINEIKEYTTIITFRNLGYDIDYNPNSTQISNNVTAAPDFILHYNGKDYLLEQNVIKNREDKLKIKLTKFKTCKALSKKQNIVLLNKVIEKDSDGNYKVYYNGELFEDLLKNNSLVFQSKKDKFGNKPYVTFCNTILEYNHYENCF